MYKNKTIVIAGKNLISVSSVKFLCDIVDKQSILILPNAKDKGKDNWQPSLLKFAIDNELKVAESLEELYEISNLIFISLEYDKIISPQSFNSKALFNIHFSLLPAYKGMYTSTLPLLHGRQKSGVTLHKIDRGIDTGDILDQIEFPIANIDSARTLYYTYTKFALKLFKKNIKSIIENQYKVTPQPIMESSYYSKESLDYTNIKINLNKTAFEISNQIRAFTFREYQIPKVNGYPIRAIKILSSKSTKKAGTIIEDTPAYISISSIDYDCKLYKDYFEELLQVCNIGNIKKTKEILPHITNLNEKNVQGWTPLMITVYNNYYDLSKLLILHGADINETNHNGTTILMYAKDGVVNNGGKDIRILIELLKHGANPLAIDKNKKTIFDYLVAGRDDLIINVLKKFS